MRLVSRRPSISLGGIVARAEGVAYDAKVCDLSIDSRASFLPAPLPAPRQTLSSGSQRCSSHRCRTEPSRSVMTPVYKEGVGSSLVASGYPSPFCRWDSSPCCAGRRW
jgi:hypothetical protein